MLLDWWVRLRGIDEWPDAEATVVSMEFVPGIDGADGKSPDAKKIEFTYRDGSGWIRKGTALAQENTDLFFSNTGESFRVRYNPKKPDRYFVPGVHSTSDWFVGTFVFFALLIAGSIELARLCGCR
jgi:hypothetical protein